MFARTTYSRGPQCTQNVQVLVNINVGVDRVNWNKHLPPALSRKRPGIRDQGTGRNHVRHSKCFQKKNTLYR